VNQADKTYTEHQDRSSLLPGCFWPL
jgi:hypothetical protein